MDEDSSGSNNVLLVTNQLEILRELRAERDKTMTHTMEAHSIKLKELCERMNKADIKAAVMVTKVNIALGIAAFLATSAVAAAIAMWAK